LSLNTGVRAVKTVIAISVLSLVAFTVAGQEAEDGVIGTCIAQGNENDVCICASLMLHARLGDEQYTRFGAISERIAAIGAGGVEAEGEMDALTSEGFRYFVPHGQAIAVCKQRLASGS
jgi:hypothetical protein